MDTFFQDLRFAARMLIARPAFTALAVIALALGIGANSAIFSVVNTVLLKPLPMESPERVVVVFEHSTRVGRFSISVPNFVDWLAQQQVFEHLAAFTRTTQQLTGGGEPERISGAAVTSEFFPALAAKPLLGRGFLPAEDKPGAEPTTVLGYALWQRRFGGDPSIVGKPITLGGKATTVIGVMPKEVTMPSRAEIWVPFALDPAKNSRGAHFLVGLARLKSGVTPQAAEVGMDAIAKQLEQQYPDSNTGWDVDVMPLQDLVVRDVKPALLVLLGAVGCVLLIACANVANLLLARAATREKEIAVRTALGAGRGRLLRQLLTEGLLLSLLGAALGLLAAYWSIDLILAAGPKDLPRAAEIGIDGKVLLFTVGIALATGILFGLVPALQASVPNLAETLKEGSGKTTAGTRRHRVRSALVVAEVALALMLLVGAGLMVKSFLRLQDVPPGFGVQGVVTARVALPEAQYAEDAQRATFFKALQERVSALPGVSSASIIDELPLSNSGSMLSFVIEGQPEPPPGQEISSHIHVVGNDYFKTMQIPILRGRPLTEHEAWDLQDSLVINETMALKLWPGQDALGQRISFGGQDGPWLTVVGIAGDVHHSSLEDEPGMDTYIPFMTFASDEMSVIARTEGDIAPLTPAIREQIRQLNPNLPVFDVSTLEQKMADAVSRPRFNLLLLGLFASLALLLAVVGIYGVMAYTVTERTREVGIRMALGANRGDVLRMILRQGMTLVFIGLALGFLGSFALSRALSSLLFGVSVTDPIVFAAVATILIAIALVAVYVPARRATKVDPMVALRYE